MRIVGFAVVTVAFLRVRARTSTALNDAIIIFKRLPVMICTELKIHTNGVATLVQTLNTKRAATLAASGIGAK